MEPALTIGLVSSLGAGALGLGVALVSGWLRRRRVSARGRRLRGRAFGQTLGRH